MGPQLALDEDRQLWVEGCKHLRARLHDGHRQSPADQVFGHLQADETGADHNRRARSSTDIGGQEGGVFNRAKRPHPLVARYRWPHRSRTRAQHQLVVADHAIRSGSRRADGDGAGPSVYGDHFAVDPDIEAKPVEELLGCLQRQVFLLLDQTPDEVGQATVGERHVS